MVRPPQRPLLSVLLLLLSASAHQTTEALSILPAPAPMAAGRALVLPMPEQERSKPAWAAPVRPSPFPAMHFGCNTTGPESAGQLRNLSRYQMPIFEFRQQCCGITAPWNDTEATLSAQATALAATSPGARSWVYRNAEMGSMFALQRPFMDNPANDYLFLGPARIDPKYNISWRTLNFSVKAAADWYVDVMVAEAAAEGPAVAGVFFDGVDGDVCASTSPDAGRLFNDTVAVFRRACERLKAAGKGCILSMINSFVSAQEANVTHCPLPEDAVVQLMGTTPWMRYYQHWLNGFIGRPATVYSAQRCAAMTANAIKEGNAGIPMVARAPADTSVYAVDLRLSLAAFLIGAAPGSTYGYGSCWFDQCWAWQRIYDELGTIGQPLGPAAVSANGMLFSRSWEGVNVELDCEHATASFRLRHGDAIVDL